MRYLIIQIAILLIPVILLRHTWIRSRYFLQMFQQVGYKTNEFRSWIAAGFNDKVFTIEHFLMNVVLFLLIFFAAGKITYFTGAVTLAVFLSFWFWQPGRYVAGRDKKPLVVTSRVKRLLVVFFGLMGPLYGLIALMVWFQHLTGMQIGGGLLGSGVGSGTGFGSGTGSGVGSGMGSGMGGTSIEPGIWLQDPYLLTFMLLLVDMVAPLLLLFAGWLVKPVEKQIQEGFKRQAREKLASLPHLKVIAITGSYGKTSTKFMIDTLLRERYQVCTTPGSFNTPMGICKVINNDLKATHQVLILEMGARYAGNITELCSIAQPDISVVTNVGKAHLETFGTRDVIAYEKGTLARELKPGGVLVANGEDERVAAMGRERDDIERVLVGSVGSIRAGGKVSVGHTGTEFEMIWMKREAGAGDEVVGDVAGGSDDATVGVVGGGDDVTGAGGEDTGAESAIDIVAGDVAGAGAEGAGAEGASDVVAGDVAGEVAERGVVQMPLFGEHNIMNFMLAAGVARSLGIRFQTVVRAATRLKPVEHRLELKQMNGITVIDDAFNSNPEGARSAIDLLAAFPTGRKFVITPGMIELGEDEEMENRRFGEYIAEKGIDVAILVGPDRVRPIQAGIGGGGATSPGGTEVVVVRSLFEANDEMARRAQAGDVVLYENDLPDTYSE